MPGRKTAAASRVAAAPVAAPEPQTAEPSAPVAPKRRLVMLAGSADSGETCRTFVFKEESHTLGNALKNVILQNPSVAFCGYSIPHPAEDQMFLRIQTVPGAAATDVLRKGLQDLKAMCQVTRMKFEDEMEDFKSSQ